MFWATNYYVHSTEQKNDGVALGTPTGKVLNNLFDFIKSKPSGTFAARIVTDQAVTDQLKALHK